MWQTLRRKWVVILAVVVLGPLGYYGVKSALDQERRAASRRQLKQIGLALHSYHEQYGSFPPAYVPGPDGQPWHSWRTLLLPFLDSAELYAQYRFDEPWDGPNNRKLQTSGPAVYTSPLQRTKSPGTASYLAVVSRRTMWPAYFPVGIKDVTDGISNTIQLVEDRSSDILWSEPRDLRERDALNLLKTADSPKAGHSTSETFHVLLANGSARSITPFLNRQLFIALLTPRATELMVDDERWPKGLLGNETPTAAKLPPVAPLDRFPGTGLLVVPEEDIEADKTSLYSATVQIAWDQLRPKEDGPATTHDATTIITLLNAHPFPKDALAKETYFAGVASSDDQGRQDLLARFRKAFPNSPAKLRDAPQDEGALNNGLHVWAHMEKSMPFADVMERFPNPLAFPAKDPRGHVQSFGWPSSVGEGGAFPILQQTVAIRDYVSDDEFIVSLHTESPQGDEIILAKITPDRTLQATWEQARDRLPHPKGSEVLKHLRGIDQLQIPILSFGIEGRLHKLIGLPVPMPSHPMRYIAEAIQELQFRLDEYGAELIADTQMLVGENGHGPDLKPKPLTPRRFVFDRPFLLAIRERNADVPYFLAWIGNADLMEPAK